jgi:hypothetical protein
MNKANMGQGDKLRIDQMQVEDLRAHLEVFLGYINLYPKAFDIPCLDLDFLNRQFLVLSWINDIQGKLNDYSRQVKGILKKLETDEGYIFSTAHLLDLPRPPVFVVHSNIRLAFMKCICQLKRSKAYSERIGQQLQILNVDVTAFEKQWSRLK